MAQIDSKLMGTSWGMGRRPEGDEARSESLMFVGNLVRGSGFQVT